TGGVFLCLTAWKGVGVVDNLTADQVNTFADGAAATCSVPEVANKIIRETGTGRSFLMDGGGTRHAIPTGGVFLCLRAWKGTPLLDNLTVDQVNTFADGAAATCSVPEVANK